MATTTDYIPSKIADFAVWLANFSALLTLAPATYGLTAPDAVAVAAQATAFADAYALSSVPLTRTTGTIANTNAARAISTAVVRPYAVRIAANTLVSPDDKVAIGVTVRSLSPSPIPTPTTTPGLTLESAITGRQVLRFYDTSTPASKSKPFGATGMQLFRAIGTLPAIDPAQAIFYGVITKSPFPVDFDAASSGKKCTYFARWAAQSGVGGVAAVGPWSEALTVGVM
jgi:hypothetical protein